MGEMGRGGLPGAQRSGPTSHELAQTALPVASGGRGLARVTCLGPVLSGAVWAEVELAGKTAPGSRRLLLAEAGGGGQRRRDRGTQRPGAGCVFDSAGGPRSSCLPGAHCEGQPGPQPTDCQPALGLRKPCLPEDTALA